MNLVYYSNLTRNTQRFVSKLGLPSIRIEEGIPFRCVLVTPTYGNAGIPKQVLKALRDGPRDRIIGVIGTGNINFGDNYCAGAIRIAQKLEVPLLYKLELAGTSYDVETTLKIMEEFYGSGQRRADGA